MTATVVPFQSSPKATYIPEGVPTPDVEACAVEATEGFETLRDRGRDLLAKGSYREAAAVYRQAARLAIAASEGDLADAALCGWGAAETELGNGAKVMPELRRILLGSEVDDNCWLASYTLARAHELEGQIRKALFYARLSHHHSAHADRPGVTGLSHNLLGNLLVAEGRETDAATEYRTALRHAEDSPPAWIAGAETNLGYCLLVGAIRSKGLRRGRMREGLRLIYRSIRTFRREGAVQYSMLPHLDLCFAHLELHRPATARRHGERALALAKKYDDAATIKNSLYLLGHVALMESDSETARQYFGELGGRFYPDQAGLTDVLMSLDLRQVVNLRA